MTKIQIEVEGLDRLQRGMAQFAREIARNMSEAAHEAGKEIVETQGVQKYPPETAANKPPTPYYQRGFGVINKTTTRATSENYGKQFYIKREGQNTTIGNRASYAGWLAGKEQAKALKLIGWRKLVDVAREKIGTIKRIYQAWINKTIKDLGL